MRKYSIVFFLLTLLSGCYESPERNDGEIIGSIKCVELEHLSDKYDSHSVYENMKMYFYLEIENHTFNTVSFSTLMKKIDDLYLPGIASNLKLELDSNFHKPSDWNNSPMRMNYSLVAVEASNKSTLLKPKSKVILKCRLLSYIYGINLKHTESYYREFLSSSFSIKSTCFPPNTKTVVFKKSPYFHLLFNLDGKMVDFNDTVSMSKVSNLLVKESPARRSIRE